MCPTAARSQCRFAATRWVLSYRHYLSLGRDDYHLSQEFALHPSTMSYGQAPVRHQMVTRAVPAPSPLKIAQQLIEPCRVVEDVAFSHRYPPPERAGRADLGAGLATAPINVNENITGERPVI